MPLARKLSVILALVICSAFVQAQSLGDVARQNRQQQGDTKAQADQPKKVYGNDDLPQEGLADDDSASSVPERSQAYSSQTPNQNANAAAANGAQMKSQIQAQEHAIAALQSQIDRINDSIHFVTARAYYNGVQHNERQVEKQEEVQRLQGQLEEQKARLQQMQEAARHAGFGNAVYEP